MRRTTNIITATISGLVVLAGCAAPVDKPNESGFLSDYSKLEMKEKGDINYLSDRASQYDSFILEPVEILFDLYVDDPVFTDEEIKDLKQYFIDEMTEALTKGDDGYKIVTAAGPGVARIRIGITELDETVGALNVTIYTKITGAGLGGISAEGEMLDSVTGEQIGAAVRWGNGSRVLRAGFTHLGDAKIAIGKWSKDVREAFDEAHGR